MRTLFFVQPYAMRRHRLVATGAVACDTQEEATATGARLARFRAGVVVLSQEVDAAAGRLGRPTVIAVHGRVPEAWSEPRIGQAAA